MSAVTDEGKLKKLREKFASQKGKFDESVKLVSQSYAQFPNGVTVSANQKGVKYYDDMGTIYRMSPSGKITQINNISSGGSRRRRRPSRKYKKSKRVLRRKSRSTRRR